MTSYDSSSSLPDAELCRPTVLRCPRCAQQLARLPWAGSRYWICPNSHGFSNPAVLIAELRARGWWPG